MLTSCFHEGRVSIRSEVCFHRGSCAGGICALRDEITELISGVVICKPARNK